jgi:hypothetical protein
LDQVVVNAVCGGFDPEASFECSTEADDDGASGSEDSESVFHGFEVGCLW